MTNTVKLLWLKRKKHFEKKQSLFHNAYSMKIRENILKK